MIYLPAPGFDFSLQSQDSGTAGSDGVSTPCAVLQCTENLYNSLPDHLGRSRKITTMTIYRRAPEDGSQWEQLTSVSTATPRDHRVSDGRHIKGDLIDLQAGIAVELQNTEDCLSTEFACVLILVDNKGHNTVIKSFVGGNSGSGLDPSAGPGPAIGSKSSSGAAEQSAEIGEVKQLIASLGEKLDSMEKRLADSVADDKRLDMEDLKMFVTDKVHGLEGIVNSQKTSSSQRIEDRLDRLESLLEDKLSLPSEVNRSKRDSLNASTCLSTAITTATLTSLVTEVSSLSTITGNLVTGLNAHQPVCCGGQVPVDEFFDVLDTGKKEWRLVFRGTAYNNVKIYPAYMHGTGIPAVVEPGCKQFNHSLPCVNHYRNRDAFENWANIDEVLLAVFDKGQIKKNIVFNGNGSTPISWFEASRVITSSWNDLKTAPHNIFSIEGDARPLYMRRFLINNDYTTCTRSHGWFYAGEALDGGCLMDKTIARPFFQYSTLKTMAVWHTQQDVARADTFGVFVKYI